MTNCHQLIKLVCHNNLTRDHFVVMTRWSLLFHSHTTTLPHKKMCRYYEYGRSCLPCTALPYSHTAAWPRGSRHSMYCAISSEWGLFGRNTRSAFRRTPSRYHIVTTKMMQVVRKTQTNNRQIIDKSTFLLQNTHLFGYLRFFLYLCGLIDVIWERM